MENTAKYKRANGYENGNSMALHGLDVDRVL